MVWPVAPAGQPIWPGPWPNPKCFQYLATTARLVSTLDPVKTRGDAALKQRPVEAERQRHVAAFDHLVGLFRRARHTADRDAAFEDAGFGARHQRQHLGVVGAARSEEHTSELQSRLHLVCRLLLEKKKKKIITALLLKKKKNQK